MKPDKVVAELMEMRRKVLREMPHVDCRPVMFEGACVTTCNCYKSNLLRDLRAAEMLVRSAAGMEPFC